MRRHVGGSAARHLSSCTPRPLTRCNNRVRLLVHGVVNSLFCSNEYLNVSLPPPPRQMYNMVLLVVTIFDRYLRGILPRFHAILICFVLIFRLLLFCSGSTLLCFLHTDRLVFLNLALRARATAVFLGLTSLEHSKAFRRLVRINPQTPTLFRADLFA